MRWRRICFSLCLLSLSPLAALTRLPEEFTVAEHWLSLTHQFDISTTLGPFALAQQRPFSLTPFFDLIDPEGRPLASAGAHLFSWGTEASVFNAGGEKIGRIEEVIWKIFPWAEYKIFNRQDLLVATAKMNFWGTHFTLFPPENPQHVYATIERPFIRIFRDHWTVQIRDFSIFQEEKIDPCLLIMLAVYQTDKDNRDRLRSEMMGHLIRESDQHNGARINF